jgi:hypothetical protein
MRSTNAYRSSAGSVGSAGKCACGLQPRQSYIAGACHTWALTKTKLPLASGASVLNQKFVYQFGDGPASGVGDANGSPGSEDRAVE